MQERKEKNTKCTNIPQTKQLQAIDTHVYPNGSESNNTIKNIN